MTLRSQYLKTYGSVQQLVSFYLRHRLLKKAVAHVVDVEFTDAEAIFHSLILPCVDSGEVKEFSSYALDADPGLVTLRPAVGEHTLR